MKSTSVQLCKFLRTGLLAHSTAVCESSLDTAALVSATMVQLLVEVEANIKRKLGGILSDCILETREAAAGVIDSSCFLYFSNYNQ